MPRGARWPTGPPPSPRGAYRGRSLLSETSRREAIESQESQKAFLSRRGFGRRLETACEFSRRRTDHSLALVLLDLDHFKEVNDSAGHALGDELLQQVSEVLEEAVREEDAVARLGGDEFALLLGDASDAVALEVAERVRARLAAHDFSHDGRRFRVSASIGVAMFQSDDDDRTLMARADKASYAAKQGGRNRVVMARGAPAGLAES